MNSFFEDNLKRESINSCSSSLSKDSNDSQISTIIFPKNSLNYKKLNEQQSKEKISYSGQFLFFGPLILCLILLISGFILFIIVEQRNNKQKNTEILFNNRFNLTSYGLFKFSKSKKQIIINIF